MAKKKTKLVVNLHDKDLDSQSNEAKEKRLANLKPVQKGEIRNKTGRNQWTDKLEFNNYRSEAAYLCHADLNKLEPTALAVIQELMISADRDAIRLKAAELVIAYLLDKPANTTRHTNADGSNLPSINTILVMPQQTQIIEAECEVLPETADDDE